MQLSAGRLFLIDALGALTSMLLLGWLLPMFEEFFGMPKTTLYLLAGLAGGFFIYSFTCFLWAGKRWRAWMRGIAVINLSYCILTLVLCFWHYPFLSVWGWGYFIGELFIVLFLVRLEWRMASSGSKTPNTL